MGTCKEMEGKVGKKKQGRREGSKRAKERKQGAINHKNSPKLSVTAPVDGPVPAKSEGSRWASAGSIP